MDIEELVLIVRLLLDAQRELTELEREVEKRCQFDMIETIEAKKRT